MAGYAMLDDIYGKPALMLRVEMPRTSIARGLALSNYALAALVILSVLFGSVVSVLLARAVQRGARVRPEDPRVLPPNHSRRDEWKAHRHRPLGDIQKLCGTPIAQWRIRLPEDLPGSQGQGDRGRGLIGYRAGESLGIRHCRGRGGHKCDQARWWRKSISASHA